jgi:hypothetical protein
MMLLKRIAASTLPAVAAVLCAASLLFVIPTNAMAQAEPAGLGPGTYIQAGAVFSNSQIDYGQRTLGGAAFFVDAHLYRRFGAEAEARVLTLNQNEGVHETTYLVGPRYSVLAGHFRPYGKLLIGRSQFYFPFHYAQGSYFVLAPGFGVDWHAGRSRLAIRIVDVEMQNWSGFSFGPMKPYGISSGVALRVF